MTGRPRVLETTTVCPDCGGPKYRYATYCRHCKSKGERNSRFGSTLTDATRAKMSAAASRPKPARRGAAHPMWKGDDASKQQGRGRAETLYPELQPCAVCGSSRTERHHGDGNTLNNLPDNVVFLCRRHHRQIHPGRGRVPLHDWRVGVKNLRQAEALTHTPDLFSALEPVA